MAEWGNAHNLTYFLIGFAHLTDGVLSDAEKGKILTILQKYIDIDNDFAEEVFRDTQGEYMTDMGYPSPTDEGIQKAQQMMVACAKSWSDGTNRGKDALSGLLYDTVELANIDGMIDTEEALIKGLAELWDVDVKF